MTKNLLILGLGNPIMSDDATGIIIARRLFEALRQVKPRVDCELAEASLSGWRLMDLLEGYENVVIVDSVCSQKDEPGTLCSIDSDNFKSSTKTSSHGAGILSVLKQAKELGMAAPKNVYVYAVTVRNPYEFGEKIDSKIDGRLSDITEKLLNEVLHTGREIYA